MMAETTSMGVFGRVKMVLQSSAAGFAFGESALLALDPALMEEGSLLAAAAVAAERVGSSGVGVVTACLMFTSSLISLGSGFLLAATVMRLLTKADESKAWLAEGAVGPSIVVAAVATGAFGGLIPAWIYITAHCIMAFVVYSYSNMNEMTTALLIIFTTLYVSVVYGRMGIITGIFTMVITVFALCAIRRALKERVKSRPSSQSRYQLLERVLLYSVIVAMLGFMIGLGAGEGGLEVDVSLMLRSVLWVGVLSAGLLGAALGTVSTVSLGSDGAGRVAIGAALASSIALRAILPVCPLLGVRGSVGGILGVATAAGVSLGAASVAVKSEFKARNTTLVIIFSVIGGAILATRGLLLKTIPLTPMELLTITLVAVGAFILGAPQSPFHTRVNLRRGLLVGHNLIRGIGMETITAAAAPLGAGALGAAALGTAALGKLGTLGVLVTIVLALVKTMSGLLGNSPPKTDSQRD